MSFTTRTIALCRHVKTDGHQCQSPALKGRSLCFFHRHLHLTHRQPETAESLLSTWQESTLEGFRLGEEDPLTVARAYPRQNEFHFPPLEDAASVQLATSMLFHAIATGQVHLRRARLLIALLKVAAANQRALARVAQTDTSPIATEVVTTRRGHTLATPIAQPIPEPAVAEATTPTRTPTPSLGRTAHQPPTAHNQLVESAAHGQLVSATRNQPVDIAHKPHKISILPLTHADRVFYPEPSTLTN